MKVKVLSLLLSLALVSLISFPGLSYADVLQGHYCGANIGQDLSPAVDPQNYEFVSELHELDIELAKHGNPNSGRGYFDHAPKGCKARTQALMPKIKVYWENSYAARKAIINQSRVRKAKRVVAENLSEKLISKEEAQLINELVEARRSYCVEQISEAFENLRSAQSRGLAKRKAAQNRKNDVIKGCTSLKKDIVHFFANALDADI